MSQKSSLPQAASSVPRVLTADTPRDANYPINGLVSVLATGTFGGGSLTIEVYDGANWAASVTARASPTAPGAIVWQGAALGIRAKLTGSTNPSINATTVFADMY